MIAEKAHATYTEDRLLADKVKVILCDNYNSIMLHSPYAELGVECTINELRLLSIILSKPKTGSQTFHGDSPKRGCSLLMSAGRRQYLTVLLNSFKAMRSLDRMLPKRTEALEYVRARLLAEETPDVESAAWAIGHSPSGSSRPPGIDSAGGMPWVPATCPLRGMLPFMPAMSCTTKHVYIMRNVR